MSVIKVSSAWHVKCERVCIRVAVSFLLNDDEMHSTAVPQHHSGGPLACLLRLSIFVSANRPT